jgi:hypothetical protein
MRRIGTHGVVIIVVLFALALVFFGCSTEKNPMSNSSAQTSELTADRSDQSVKQATPSPYPVLTDAELANLIPGHQVLKVDTRMYRNDGALDDQTSVRIRKTVGGTVSHRNNGVEIGAWQLWEDQTVTVSTPNPGSAVVDFYPHPYHFNGCIRIWIDLRAIQLPAGMRWDQLEFYYVNDQGQYVRYWGQLDLVNMRYSAWPDHFSRYIITAPSLGR